MNLVTNLAAHKNKALVGALEEILKMAKDGEISGLACVIKFGPADHRAGAFGDYKSNPSEALKAALILKSRIVGDVLPSYGGSIKGKP